MEVQKISETVQKFDGLSYYLCGRYFQRKGVRLHRKVWEYHNGEIPQGYDIHHIDGDRANNNLSNLALIDEHKHMSLHMKEPERIEKSKQSIVKAMEKAKEWHKSEAGLEWHRNHMTNVQEKMRNRPMQTFVCAYCGKEFQSNFVRSGNRYCCNNHRVYHTLGRRYEDSREAKSKQC